MTTLYKSVRLVLIVTLVVAFGAAAQITVDQLHGDETATLAGLHSGNMIRTHFYNDGMIGDRQPDEIGGEWPINSGHEQLSKLATMIGAEVLVTNDSTGKEERLQIISEGNGSQTGNPTGSASSGDADPSTGSWWTMAPLPYFANQFPEPDNDGNPREAHVAMSHWPWSWPNTWPDKFDDAVDPGWAGSWNGYFGKDVLNADQESYYVMDDYLNREYPFYPDSTNTSRRGLGVQATVRQFQWSNVLVEDCLFFLYDAKNIGTYEHDKMVFGMVAGPNIGASSSGGSDSDDDGGAYILEENLGYQFDEDNIGGGGYTPVPLLGFAFFEAPGNPFDGIDNDGDGNMSSGIIIDESTFAPRSYNVGDPIILTDYSSFERTISEMPAQGVKISYLGRDYTIQPGEVVEEIQNDLIDNNLNGLIDESNGSEFGEGEDAIFNYLYVGLRAVDFFSGAGLDNLLIDEERDDGIDNDGDWVAKTDDVGMDGVPNTGDSGEGDGQPTSGAGTGLPGEPHIDKTDIDESDMIGLTSFNIHEPWTIYPLSDDQIIWDEAIRPGFLNEIASGGNTDIFLGSGYFPLQPQQIERFSLGMLYGYGPETDELIRNKQFAEKTYLENYNFAKAPNLPTVNAVPGDGKVTLYWDTYAEESIDPITGKDFQGYRIYRSTDPGFTDMTSITNGFGDVTYRKPLAQFDLDDGISGYAGLAVGGVHFWLGDDTGIVNSFTDTTAVNGQTYYYAVTAYDAGSDSLGIVPTETAKYISIAKSGEIQDKGSNVVQVRPEAPSNGYVEAGLENMTQLEGSTSTGNIGYEIIDPNKFIDGADYRVTFEDTLVENDSSWQVPTTKSFNLINITTGDTLINNSTNLAPGADQPMTDGFKLALYNADGVQFVSDSTGWRIDTTAVNFEPDSAGLPPYVYEFEVFRYSRTQGVAALRDYRIDFYDEVGVDTSLAADFGPRLRYDAMPVNFTVTDANTGEKVPFAFDDADQADGEEGMFTAMTGPRQRYTDQIIFLEPNKFTEDTLSWSFTVDRASVDSAHRAIKAGDYFVVKMTKPFLSNDVYEFSTKAASVVAEEMDLEKIKVVPNPYVVANSWEPLNPYSNGRGPRELHFTHLPPQCTIKIFNIRGQLVRELEHDHASNVADGTEIWDMLTKDQMDIAYGIYVYHVDAGEYGTKIGKFAVIK